MAKGFSFIPSSKSSPSASIITKAPFSFAIPVKTLYISFDTPRGTPPDRTTISPSLQTSLYISINSFSSSVDI
ncbi:hypothetical protein D3C73_1360590 [compost metagenome]